MKVVVTGATVTSGSRRTWRRPAGGTPSATTPRSTHRLALPCDVRRATRTWQVHT